MMRHIFGATAIPLPPVNQLQRGAERGASGAMLEEQLYLM